MIITNGIKRKLTSVIKLNKNLTKFNRIIWDKDKNQEMRKVLVFYQNKNHNKKEYKFNQL